MDLLDLCAKITLDTSEYETGLDSAEESAGGFASKLGSGLVGAGKAVVGVMTATKAAASAVGGAMVTNASKTAEYGDKIDKASQKLGISSTAYQEWDAVLQHSGTSMDSMGASFKKLATASQNASKDQVAAFKAIGLSMDEVSNMSTEELWSRTIAGLQGMEEGTERTAIATQLLGKGAMELGPLLNTSAEDTQAMIDTVNELGGVMSEDAVKASAAFEDSLQDLKTGFGNIGRTVGEAVMPALTTMMDFAIEKTPEIQSAFGEIFSQVSAWFDDAVTFVSDHFDTISEVITTVIGGITEVFQVAWDFTSGIFSAIGDAIGEMTDSMDGAEVDFDGAWELISDTVSTVGEIIQSVIRTVGSVISWLVKQTRTDGTVFNSVFNGMSKVVSAAAQIINGVLKGVAQLLNGDFSGAVNTIGSTFSSVFPNISSTVTNAMETVRTAADDAISFLKRIFSGELTFPHIKIPHFHISGGEIPWGIGGAGTAPSVSVEWYAKAMQSGILFNRPTVMSTADGLKGFGDRGAEMVIGQASMMNMIADAQAAGMGQVASVLAEILGEMRAIRTNLYETIVNALDEIGVDVDGQEVMRLIRKYA